MGTVKCSMVFFESDGFRKWRGFLQLFSLLFLAF